MSSLQLIIWPRDILFCRDARPIGGAAIGSGGSWPLPGTFHNALLAALYRCLDLTPQEGRENRLLQSLRTAGPFPFSGKEKEIYFPTPGDLLPGGKLYPAVNRGVNNLPRPLSMVLNSTGAPTKEKLNPWIAASELKRYVNGETDDIKTIPSEELFGTELRPGIGIDRVKRVAAEKKFYMAEYLRLRDEHDVTMTAFAEMNGEILNDIFAEKGSIDFCFGGQRGLASIAVLRDCGAESWLPFAPSITDNGNECMVKWVLLTPAMFNAGFLPDWVNPENGQVMLPSGETTRHPGESRRDWRRRLQSLPPIRAKLVAAKVDKPIAASGWKLNGGTELAAGIPRATRLLVPPGSVYYFKCENPEETRRLHRSLYGRSMSGSNGEQGLGIGITANV
ncbi:MAG: type III-B CRISPR module-associated Cmr3 family protein [Victivallaceae bacterium]